MTINYQPLPVYRPVPLSVNILSDTYLRHISIFAIYTVFSILSILTISPRGFAQFLPACTIVIRDKPVTLLYLKNRSYSILTILAVSSIFSVLTVLTVSSIFPVLTVLTVGTV